ncbi:response regulator transcription factor [Sphingomonas sp. AP4-R1]|uniref:response regulator transcription factor n=1 Tax=Sphingomonas sp. AP4-R1 TaxID=2735134 RepID=UPI0014934A5E|nr:response regulator transcription factor [Sphingomonas sp. AP4-R1]QJU60096.1 response regulator transcription factor [Sphingomonas sp. AP4-R1]
MNILLVEDDAGIGRFVNRGLAARGHRVAWERTAARVSELAETGCFDAVLLDLGLPDGDGLEICRMLRATGNIPVMMLTARDAVEDRLEGFDAGADDYLPKPFAFEELIARLRVIERRVAERAPEPLRHHDLTVDGVLREVRCRGRLLPCGGKAFDLLLQLVRAKDAVIGRQCLIDALWGEEAHITDNTLDVHIGSLRRRLAAAGTAVTIETVRGQGFRLTGGTETDPRYQSS